MAKLLVVLLVVAVALWALLSRTRGTRRKTEEPRRPQPSDGAGAAQDMVRCARCGVHLPASDAVQAGGRSYCGAEHAAAGPRGP
jgi:uncharacterized protein